MNLTNESIQVFDNEKSTKVSTIHFLIHPGSITDPDMGVDNNQQKEGQTLLDKYEAMAKSLGPDEVMFVFTHTDGKELKDDLKTGKEYIRTLHRIKEILGKRFILLTCDKDIFYTDEAFRTAKDIAQRRGFDLSTDTRTVSYGENLDVCVVESANNLNKSGKFIEKTIVIPNMTNVSILSPNQYRERVTGLGERHSQRDRVLFQEVEIDV